MGHYRPVSTQPFLSLLLEKCAHSQIVNYLESNNLMYKGQFGFRKGHSCEIAMAALMDYVYQQLDKGMICVILSLDLSKAFDVIIRRFLIQKLEWYGIDPKWLTSYLSYRCQAVRNKNGELSEVIFTVRGCPQSSVLGSLIFSIYINDLPCVVKHCISILFADDTQLCFSSSVNEVKLLLSKMTEDINAIVEWMANNGMKLNVEKTQMIVLGNARNINKVGELEININGTMVKSSETMKSLGLTIDNKLTWINHINKISRSYHLAAKSLYPLRSLVSKSDIHILMSGCTTSIINYMVSIWGSASKKNILIVDKIIRRNARIMLGKKKFDPVKEDLHKTLGWLLADESYKLRIMCLIHRLKIFNDIPYFKDLLLTNSQIHNIDTRNGGELRINRVGKTRLGNRMIQSKVSEYNNLPKSVKDSRTMKAFSKSLKKLILNEGIQLQV